MSAQKHEGRSETAKNRETQSLPREYSEKSVYELALERVEQAYDRFDKIVVSFSGGKDSTAVLNVALEVAKRRGALPLECVFWDEEVIHPETIDYVQRVADLPEINMRWFCVPLKHRNGCSRHEPYWYPWAPEDEERWVRYLPETALLEDAIPGFQREPHYMASGRIFPASDGNVGLLLGIRADESLRRLRMLLRRHMDNWISVHPISSHVYVCKPIYDWTTEDVWTAPQLMGWDWNRAYDKMSKAGIKPPSQRVCQPFGEQPMENLWMYAKCWPELWDQMVDRVDGAAAAGRWARSPLYGYGGVIKPDDMTYKEAIPRALQMWPPHLRKDIAKRLRKLVVKYRTVYKEDVPEVSYPGQIEEITWKYLYELVVKGDLKGRKTPKLNPEEWRKWKAEQ